MIGFFLAFFAANQRRHQTREKRTRRSRYDALCLVASCCGSLFASLQALVRYPTISVTAPDTGAYKECADYLLGKLQSIPTLEDIHILPESPDHSPVVVACWKGHSPELPVILLNSHYDVVPASDDWTVPPFEALRTEGRIYGRGTQDMKCVCIQ
jgi:acetylornithine deacetylase/succinyl-diaminopimelate desuccinylase-like protein